jgi:DNA primase
VQKNETRDWEHLKLDVPGMVEKLGLDPEIDGDEMTVYCPFHREGSRPNMGINATSGLWHCWSCGEKGNLPKLVSKLRDISWREAVQILIDNSGLPTVEEIKERNLRELEAILKKNSKGSLPEVNITPFIFGGAWWTKFCGFDKSFVKDYSLGFDSIRSRAVIPVRYRGKWVGIIRRAVRHSQAPKYLYNKGFDRGSVLFPWDHLPRHCSSTILVEGPRDVLRLHSYSVKNALAVMGLGITANQLGIIVQNFDEVTVWFDNDIYGQINNLLVAEQLSGLIPRVYVAPFENDKVKDQFEMSKSEVRKSLRNRLHWSYLA